MLRIMVDNNRLPEFKGQIIDIFEDYCDENDIAIENAERVEYNKETGFEEGENDVKIFGADYDALGDKITSFLSENNNEVTEVQISRFSVDLIGTFTDILKERGTTFDIKRLNDAEKKKIGSKILDTLRRWDILNAA